MRNLQKFGGQPAATSPHRRPESPKRGLMSGETLRASRQQLRLLRASGFCFCTQSVSFRDSFISQQNLLIFTSHSVQEPNR